MLADKEEILVMIQKVTDVPVIVEGKKDKAALEKVGFTTVIPLKADLFNFCEKISISYREIMILTDMDAEGKKLYLKIKSYLDSAGVRVDDSCRDFLLKRTMLKHIEGMDSYLEHVS